VFLHVITYNTAAMSLYSRQGFCCVAKLRAFYYIATGRTPDPQQQVSEGAAA
jgi:ribosomal protein S18 acetylase RimI-like enzyme